jgi:hypothetical protein
MYTNDWITAQFYFFPQGHEAHKENYIKQNFVVLVALWDITPIRVIRNNSCNKRPLP